MDNLQQKQLTMHMPDMQILSQRTGNRLHNQPSNIVRPMLLDLQHGDISNNRSVIKHKL